MAETKPPFDPSQPYTEVTANKPAFDPNQPFTAVDSVAQTTTPPTQESPAPSTKSDMPWWTLFTPWGYGNFTSESTKPSAQNVEDAASRVSTAGDYTPQKLDAPTRSTKILEQSDKVYSLVSDKVRTQLKDKGLPEHEINNVISYELGKLGYQFSTEELPDGQKADILKPIKNFVPDKDWLDQQQSELYNQKVASNEAFSADREASESTVAYAQGMSSLRLFGLDDNFSPISRSVKEGWDKTGKKLATKQEDTKALYAEPASRQNTVATRADENGTVIADPISSINPNDPESYAVIDSSTQALRTAIPTDHVSRTNFMLDAKAAAVNAKFFDDPAKADIKRFNHVFNMNQNTVESESYYAEQLAREKYAMSQNMDGYEGLLGMINQNIGNIQQNISTNGINSENRQKLNNNLLLKQKIEANVAAKREWMEYFQRELDGLSTLKDFTANKLKADEYAELYPYSAATSEIIRSVSMIPGNVTAAAGNYLLAAQEGDAWANEVIDRQESISKDYGFMDYLGGKKWPGSDQYTGLEPTSITKAEAFSLFDSEGNFTVNVNGPALLYNNGKVAVESFLLGATMYGSSALVGGITRGGLADLAALNAGEVAGEVSLSESLGSLGGLSSFDLSLGRTAAGYASSIGRIGGGYTLETVIGSVAPSVLMYSNEILKDEMAKGLSFKEALAVATFRASIEGLTERIFPNEMAFYKGLVGKGVIGTYKDLTEQVAYRSLIGQAFEKKFGKKMSDGLSQLIFTPTRKALDVFLEEGAEEVAGDLLNLMPNQLANKYDATYDDSDNQFNFENEINTMVATAATMMPMGARAGYAGVREHSDMQKAAQFMVGSNPNAYYTITSQLEREGKISKEEAQRRNVLIGQMTGAAVAAEQLAPTTPNYKSLTGEQRETLKQQIFNKRVEIDKISAEIASSPAETLKTPILEHLERTTSNLQNLLNSGLYETDEQRIKSTSNNLNFYVSPGSVGAMTPKALGGLKTRLTGYRNLEADQKLKDLYSQKLDLVDKRIDYLAKQKQAEEEALTDKTTVPITYANGTQTRLSIGEEYFVSPFNPNKAGVLSKVPSTRIVSKNDDGTVSVVSDGAVVEMPMSELSSYDFIPTTKVAEWRDAGDPKALVLDYSGQPFVFEFSNETPTRQKAPTGSLAWNPITNSLSFTYEDKTGAQRRQDVKSKDFTSKKVRPVAPITGYDDRVAATDFSSLDAQADKNSAMLGAFFEAESKKVTKVYDKAIKAIQETLDNVREIVEGIKEARKHPLTLDVTMLKAYLPLQEWQRIVKEKGYETNSEGAVLIPPGVTDRAAEAGKFRSKFSPYEILSALTSQLTRIQSESLVPAEQALAELVAKRDAALKQIGLDYEELLDEPYESDRELKPQVNEYRKATRDRIKEISKLIESLKTFMEDVRETIGNLLKNIINIIPKAEIAYNAELNEEGENLRNEVLDDLKRETSNADAEISRLQSESGSLKGKLEKLDKLNRFIARADKNFERAKAKVSDAKEKIYQDQFSSQTRTSSRGPVNQTAFDEASDKIPITALFLATTAPTAMNPDGTLKDPAAGRLSHFTNQVQNLTGYQLLVVTKDNAKKYGLESIIFDNETVTNNGDQEKTDIRLVVVKGTSKNFKFVDQNGAEMDAKNVTPDSVVSTAMRMPKLTWSDGTTNFSHEGMTEAEAKELGKELAKIHATSRQTIIDANKAGKTVLLPITGASRGHVNEALAPGKSSVVNTLIPPSVDLGSAQVLEVATQQTPGQRTATVYYKGLNMNIPMPIGTPVLSFNQTFRLLQTKKLTKKDVDKLVKLFKELYETAKESGVLDKSIIKYLSKVLYWRNPFSVSSKTGTEQKDETVSPQQIWIDRKTGDLFLGAITDVENPNRIPFSFEPNDRNNEAKLREFLSGLYHNIDAQEHSKNMVGEPFIEMVDVSPQGDIATIEWPSYQAYLLSDKYPDGTARAVEDIPLTTNIPASEEGKENVVSRYLTYSNNAIESYTAERPITVIQNTENPVGKTVVVYNAGAGLAGWTETPKESIQKKPGNEYLMRTILDDGEIVGRTFVFDEKGKVVLLSHNYYHEGELVSTAKVVDSLEKILAQPPKPGRSKYYYKEAKTTTPKEEPPVKKEEPKKDEEKPVDSKVAALRALPTRDGKKKGPLYRLADSTAYNLENLEAARVWFEQRFPKIPFKVIRGLVDSKAWGVVRDAAVTISDLAKIGTTYHEAFHVVTQYFTTPRERRALYSEFRRRKGSFVDEKGNKVDYSKATNDQAEEVLAEEYREYAMSGGTKYFQGEVMPKTLFQRILDFLTAGLLSAPTIQETFDRIEKGYYRGHAPNLQLVNADPRYSIADLKNQHVAFVADAMRSMTGLMVKYLEDNGIPLSQFVTSGNKMEPIYDWMKEQLDDYYGGPELAEVVSAFTPDEFVEAFKREDALNDLRSRLSEGLDNAWVAYSKENKLSFTQSLKKLHNLLESYKFMSGNWKDFTDEHMTYLGSTYQVEFEEDEEQFIEEDERNPTEYAKDHIKTSMKQNTSREVKLLIATLKELEYVPGAAKFGADKMEALATRPKLNSLLLPQLVDYNQTIISLLYKMTAASTYPEVEAILQEAVTLQPSLAPLLMKLKVGQPVASLSTYDRDLRDKFYTSMANMLANSYKLIVNPGDMSGGIVELNQQKAFSMTRDRWLHNLRLNSKIVVLQGTKYIVDKSKLRSKVIRTEKEAMDFLNVLGIDFPDKMSYLTADQKRDFMSATQELFRIVNSDTPDRILTSNAFTRGPLSTLAEMHNKLTNNYSEPTHTNVEGETVQNIILNSSFGLVIKAFNSSKNLEELYDKMPFLNPVNQGNLYQGGSLVFKKGGQYFDTDGNKKKNLTIDILDGSQVRDADTGTPTAKLNFADRIAQEFSNNLSGLFHMFVPADAKTEWGIGFGFLVDETQVHNNAHVTNVFREYLKAEVGAVQDFMHGYTSDNAFLQQFAEKGHKVGSSLRHFRGILKTIDPKFELSIDVNRTPEEIVEANRDYIDKAIVAYFDQSTEATYKKFMEEGIITPYNPAAEVGEDAMATIERLASMSDELYTVAFAPKEYTGKGLTLDEIKDLIRFRTVNYAANMIEQHKVIWGDPGMWQDPTKRTKSFMSGRMLSVANAPYFDEWHNLNSNVLSFIDEKGEEQIVELQEGEFGYWKWDSKLRYQVMEDPMSVSKGYNALVDHMTKSISEELFPGKETLTEEEQAKVDATLESKEIPEYEKMKEADAQSWATFPAYREMRMRATTWTVQDEKQYKWDMALARLELTEGVDFFTKKGIPGITKTNMYPDGARGELLRKYDEHTVNQGNPYLVGVQADDATLPTLNVLKPIQAGAKAMDRLVNNLIKTSTAPVTWRIAKGRNMMEWYVAHAKARTSLVTVKTANKVGVDARLPRFYDFATGKPNIVISNPEQVDFSTFGIQVETITQKNKTTLGTQLTKQAPLNLNSGGIPVSFIKENAGLTISQRQAKWNALPLAEKMKNEYFRLTYKNNAYLAALKEKAKDNIFEEFGIEEDPTTQTFEFKSLEKLSEMLQRELNLRSTPENVKKTVKLVPKVNPETGVEEMRFALPFDLIIGSDRLEAVITSVVDKQILRPKMHGGQMPQISSALFETNKRSLVMKDGKKWVPVKDYNALTEEQKGTVRITSNELKFYEVGKDGKTQACEIMVPYYFAETLVRGQVIDIPEELLEGIGFRIPTQGLNATEFFVIKGFLPEEYGNSIVVPSEIVVKAGSDFDIDKLNLYLHNYDIDEDGVPYKIQYIDGTSETDTRARYEEHIRPSKFYHFLNTFEGYEYFKGTQADPASTKLIEAIFDQRYMDKMDLSKTYEENLEIARTMDFMPYDEFKELPVELQNTKGAVENAYIDNLREILALPENYAQLVEPNSARILKEQADEIRRFYHLPAKIKNLTVFLDPIFNANTRHSFLVGKGGVGIAASAQSQHALSQQIGLSFTQRYDAQDRRFNFPTNSEVNDDLITYHMSEVYGTDGRTISSVISAYISSLVDVAKDAFIIDINGTLNTLGAHLAAIRMGIPLTTAVRWFNQPIILEYTKAMEANNSILNQALYGEKQKKTEIVAEVITKFSKVFDKKSFQENRGEVPVVNRLSDFTDSELKGYIEHFAQQQRAGSNTYDQEFADAQLLLLKQYMSLENLQWDLFHFGQALVDTARSVSLDAIRLKNASIIRALNGPFSESVVKALQQTFQGNILNAKLDFLEVARKNYMSEIPVIREVLDPMINDLFNSPMGREAKVKEANKLRKGLITYMLQTIPISVLGKEKTTLTNLIPALFKQKEANIAKQIRLNQNENQALPEPNFFLSNMLGTSTAGTANMRTIRKNSDKLDMDLMTSDFFNLQNSLPEFTADLIAASLLQSGVSVSPVSIHEYIPNELFAEIANQVLDYLNSPEATLRQHLANFRNSYYENVWNNKLIVPAAALKNSKGNSRLETDMSIAAEQEGKPFQYWIHPSLPLVEFFLSSEKLGVNPARQVHKPYIMIQRMSRFRDGSPKFTKTQIEDMKNRGDFSFLERTLYKRVETLNEQGESDAVVFTSGRYKSPMNVILFYPVNKKGDGINGVEHYTEPADSKFHPGKIPVLTDAKVVDTVDKKSKVGHSSGLFLNQHYFPKGSVPDNLVYLFDEDEEGNLNLVNEDILKEIVAARMLSGVTPTQKPEVFKPKYASGEEIYSKLGNKTKSKNVVIKQLVQKRGVDFAKKLGGFFSMRVEGLTKHFGNPYTHREDLAKKDKLKLVDTTKDAVVEYINWVINSQDARAKWIRDVIQSGQLKGKPIVYYKELGEPSHATALDYLVNEYDWMPINAPANLPPITRTPKTCA